jgi:hypothetical protein
VRRGDAREAHVLLDDSFELRAYLIGENGCTEGIFRLPTEMRTELTSAIVTAIRADELADATTKRLLVILSDLKEEPISQETLDAVTLKGVQVLILYRALPDDQIDQRQLEARIADWKQRLRARGATVQAAIDTAVAASGADVTRIIKTSVTEN